MLTCCDMKYEKYSTKIYTVQNIHYSKYTLFKIYTINT